MKMIIYLYFVLFFIGLVLTYFAIKHYNNTTELIRNGIKTKAKVVELIASRSDGSYTYKPVFEYTDNKNTLQTFKSEISSKPAPYKVGDRVDILYAKDGTKRKVISFWGLYRWTIILLSIASPLLIIGGGYLFYYYR